MSFEESAELEGGLPVWVECSMHRKDRRVATTVREYMCETRTEQSAWLTHPRRMLRHKALVQCARICFGLSGIYDPDEAQRIRAALALTKENSPSKTPRGNPARPSGTPGTPGTSAHKEGGEEASGQAAKTAHSKPRGAESIKQWIEKNCTT
jgi:hypothetical protein